MKTVQFNTVRYCFEVADNDFDVIVYPELSEDDHDILIIHAGYYDLKQEAIDALRYDGEELDYDGRAVRNYIDQYMPDMVERFLKRHFESNRSTFKHAA